MSLPSWTSKQKPRHTRPSVQEVRKHLQQNYGIHFVRASDIAEQLYCEKKVELRLLHPEVRKPTPLIFAGLKGHEELAAEARPISKKELHEQLASGKKVLLRESAFPGRYRGIPILGKPDLVSFDGMRPLFLVDYKFGAKREPYPDHRLQLALYGILLHQNKFETNGLVTILAFVSGEQIAEGHALGSPEGTYERELLKTYQELSETVSRQQREAIYRDQNVACFAYPFVLGHAKRLLDEQIDFWLGLRPAVPTRHERKCAVCEFNVAGLCESALTKPSPEFVKQFQGD